MVAVGTRNLMRFGMFEKKFLQKGEELLLGAWDSVVCIAIRYWMDGPGV
jgi:hypothetical protein